MTEEEKQRDSKLEEIGRKLEEILEGFFGSVRYNFKAGRLIDWNVVRCGKPEGKSQ